MGYSGSKFTWTRRFNSSSLKGARLDRALCNFGWKILFPDATIAHLPRVKSDHSPVLIDCLGGSKHLAPRQFQFHAAWLTHSGLKQVIASNWNSSASLTDNNLLMASVLRKWNKDVFGNIHKKKRRLLARIDGVQRALAHNYSNGLIKLDIKLKNELDEVLAQEEAFRFQKSRKE